MASLTVSKITKQFGKIQVLKGIDLSIDSGEFLVLVGPSGCGKSTLLNLIAGLESASSGEIRINGNMVNNISPKDRDIAMVFQSYALYPNMNVRKNLSFGLETRKVPRQEIDSIVARVAEMLQIDNLLERKPGQLSGGQRQRVAMGRALARNPKIFLFDEPLSNLDAKLRVEMRTEIKLLHQRIGTTIVYVTHDQIEAMTLADRIAIMKDGIVQQFDTPKQVYENPANLFVAGFIGSPSMNFIPCPVEQTDNGPALLLKTDVRSHLLPTDGREVLLQPWCGKTVIFGIRPEQITEQDGRGSQINSPVIEAGVKITEPTGPDTLIVILGNDEEITCRIHPDVDVAPGRKIALSMDMSKALFFDPQTGERIR
jgi:multiple sugar transport system ATP-binding protein